MPSLRVSIQEPNPKTKIVRLSGRLTLTELSPFREGIFSSLSEGPLFMILELSEVDHMDSTFFGLLIDRFKYIRREGGELVIVGLSEHLRHVFEILGGDKIFDLFTSEKEAMDHLNALASSPQ